MKQIALAFSGVQDGIEPPQFHYGPHIQGHALAHAPIFTLQENEDFAALIANTPPKAVTDPFGENISSGKNTYVYDAHTYHTKVPPAGIRQLIEYYTTPGQTVLDPFCGSGMTGVAALEAGRKALLSDLSPAATFIAYNLCTPIHDTKYMAAVRDLLKRSRELNMYLYGTISRESGTVIPMLYTVWSFGYICTNCHKEFVLWDVARDERANIRESKILSSFPCPHCQVPLQKRQLKRTRRFPVQVGYDNPAFRTKETKATLSDGDLQKLADIERRGIPKKLWYPTVEFPPGINTRQPVLAGIHRVDQAYTTRALWALAHLWQLSLDWPDRDIREKLLFTLTSLYKRVTVFSEFRFWGGSGNTANFNVPSIMNEQNVFGAFERKAKTISWYFADAPRQVRDLRVSCQSATNLSQIPDASIDYVFTDPPFGGNINYSEMNLLWESWLGVRTDTGREAIVNKYQGKGNAEYKELLCDAFREIRRVLKHGAWATIVFHNSSANIWNALQDAIVEAGLAVKGTQTFDKKHGTFKQFVSQNAVGYDLVLHCQPAATRPAVIESEEGAALTFIRELLQPGANYAVEYLHVKRKQEFDYRKIYAEWLKATIAHHRIDLNFDRFRELVDQVRLER